MAKKIITILLLSLIFLFNFIVQAEIVLILNLAQYDVNKKELTISGKFGVAEGERVSIRIEKSDGTAIYLNQIFTTQNGGFSQVVDMKRYQNEVLLSQSFKLKAMAKGATSIATKSFVYKSSEKELISFGFKDSNVTPNKVDNNLYFEIPLTEDIEKLIPVFTLSQYASMYQSSVLIQSENKQTSFANSVTYKVIAQDDSFQLYNVYVKYISNDIIHTTDYSNKTVYVKGATTLPYRNVTIANVGQDNKINYINQVKSDIYGRFTASIHISNDQSSLHTIKISYPASNGIISKSYFYDKAAGESAIIQEFVSRRYDLEWLFTNNAKLLTSTVVLAYNALGSNRTKVIEKMTLKEYTTLKAIEDEVVEAIRQINEQKPPADIDSSDRGSSGGVPSITYIPPTTNIENNNVNYVDLSEANWAEEYINVLTKKGVISGDGNGHFRPNNKIKREEYIKLLVSALNITKTDKKVNFSDLDEKAWYYEYITAACEIGIIKGLPDNTFGLGKYITREEMAALAYRAIKALNKTLSVVSSNKEFSDEANISDFAKEAVYAMQRANIINGVNNEQFMPQENATRAQAAKIIYLLIK